MKEVPNIEEHFEHRGSPTTIGIRRHLPLAFEISLGELGEYLFSRTHRIAPYHENYGFGPLTPVESSLLQSLREIDLTRHLRKVDQWIAIALRLLNGGVSMLLIEAYRFLLVPAQESIEIVL